MDSSIVFAILGGLAVIYFITSSKKPAVTPPPPGGYPTGTPPGVTTGPTLEQAGKTPQQVLNDAGITTGPIETSAPANQILEQAGITTGPTYEQAGKPTPLQEQPYPGPPSEVDSSEKQALQRFITQHRGTPEGRMAIQRYQMLYGTDASDDFLESIFGR